MDSHRLPITREEKARAAVLVVDDDRSTQVLLEELLRRLDVDISLASDGAEGLRLAQQTPFDLVIADLRMPHVTGGEMLRALEQTRCRSSHRIVFTGMGSNVTRIAPATLCCTRISKPFDLRMFLDQVERCLSESSEQHRPRPDVGAGKQLSRSSDSAPL